MSEIEPAVDAAAVVAEIKAEVARRRAAGEYPPALLERLGAALADVGGEIPLEDMAHLETVRPLVAAPRLGGQAIVECKRIIRRAVAWYVRPVVEDQSRFNFALVRRIYSLESRVRRLEQELRLSQPNGEPQDDG
jgi:hypothetical protein